QSLTSDGKRKTMCRVEPSAPKRFGLVAFSAFQSSSGMASTASRSRPISTGPSRRMDVVLRGLAYIGSELVAEQFEVASVKFRHALNQRRVVIIAIIAAAPR